ncbi:MAG: hypothetical protein ACOC5J_01230 [Gemmatimonadota bacterium]
MRALATSLIRALALAGTSTLVGQDAPPPTDVYLIAVEQTDTGWDLGEPTNLTARSGYDNQPAFDPDGRRVLYTSYRDGQADVWSATVPEGPSAAVTRTPESEYSPTPDPGGHLTVVRVEADSTQRLWRFTSEGVPVEPVLPGVEPVGYHAWLDADRVVLYVLGEPPRLRVAQPGSGEVRTVAADVGRSLQPIPGGGVSFVRFTGEEGSEAWLHRLGPDGRSTERLVRLPGDRIDHGWGPDGTVWVGVDDELWAWHPDRDAEIGFVRVSSFGGDGLGGITRVTVSPDGEWLAIVADDSPGGR